MRIQKNLRTDVETITRFLNVVGAASIILSSNKYARPSFFIQAYDFICGYIEAGFFKKEQVLIQTLEDGGFSSDEGPIHAMRSDQEKSREAAGIMFRAANHWQDGDEDARAEMGWAISVYTTAIRQHLERLKTLIFPLLEQTISIDEEHKVSEMINNLVFENDYQNGAEKYLRLIESLEDTLSDWR
jgi:hemerythrin-like domain-containing protein